MNTKYLKDDLVAGVVVFLVALPLCLGVALASDAPLFAGIISGVVGGIVVTAFSGSALGVTGPAAGLAVIVAGGIAQLGYSAFLLAVVVCGLLQIAFGFLRGGVVAHYFPSAVIKGMLAGIGVIMVLKQIPHTLGNDTDWMGDLAFVEADGHNTFSELYLSLMSIHPIAFGVAVVSLAILLLWERPAIRNNPTLRTIPGALLAVGAGTVINEIVRRTAPSLVLSGDDLVQLPVPQSLSELSSSLTLPDFSQIANPEIYAVAATLAVIASLETLLSVEATDKLDPQKRVTPTDRELKAQGIGNVAAGLLGGIPVTQVIVRSAANITAGGKTRAAALFHGVFLLLSVVLIPALLNRIPLASLAAVLILVGYKLTKVQLYRDVYRQGRQQFLPFIATVVAMVFTDLLKGVIIGLVIATFYILLYNYRTDYLMEVEEGGRRRTLRLSEHMSFLNKASVVRALAEVPPGGEVTIDGSHSVAIDYDVKEVIKDFLVRAESEGITVRLIGLDREEIHNVPSTAH